MWPFNKKSGEFHRKWDNLTQNLKVSFSSIKDDFGRVGEWIRLFNKKQIEYDDRLKKIEQKLDKLVEAREQKLERVQSFNRSSGPFMNVQSPFMNVQSPNFDQISDAKAPNLTPIQKKVIMLMLGSGIPMDYETISKKLNLNIVTVRRHINDIKRAGFDIKEKKDTSNQRKVFFLGQSGKKLIMKAKKKHSKE